MAAFPRNPPLIDNEHPEIGETRIYNEVLECLYQGAWLPAVRQHTIRAQLLNATDVYGSYTHPRPEDDNGTNRTAYLHRDRDYGEQWANLPPIIHELYSPTNRRAVKPNDVLRDATNRIMLDPYDHPIRDFPGELPIVISDKLHGVWVEYYLRSNREIRVYDLVARMGFVAKNNKAVRTARLTERATKFRKAAACSTWNDKTGSTQIRQAISNLLPPNATNTRSLGGYLSKAQLESLYSVNKGTFSNRARKTTREARATQGLAASQPPITIPSSTTENPSDRRGFAMSATPSGQYSTVQDSPGLVPRDNNKRRRAQTSLDLAASETTPPHAKRSKHAQPRSLKRDAHTASLDGTDIPNAGSAKRQKTSPSMGETTDPMKASKHIIRQAKLPNATSAASYITSPKTRHDQSALSDPADGSGGDKDPFTSPDYYCFPQSFSPNSLAKDDEFNSIESPHEDWLLHYSQQHPPLEKQIDHNKTTFVSVHKQEETNPRRSHAIQANERPATKDKDLSLLYPCVAQPRKHPFADPRQGPQDRLEFSCTRTTGISTQTDDLRATGGYSSETYRPSSSASPNQLHANTSYVNSEHSHPYFSDPDVQNPTLLEDHGSKYSEFSGGSAFGNEEIAQSNKDRSAPSTDHTHDNAFQAECMAGIIRHDYRYYHPNLNNENPEETESLQAALGLTRIDFRVKTGHEYPAELVLKHQHESYATQHWYMQKYFEAVWHDPGLAPTLYRLENKFFGWNAWSSIVDQLGQWLYDTAEGKGWIEEVGL